MQARHPSPRSLSRLALAVIGVSVLGLAGCANSHVNSPAGARMRAEKVAAFSHPIIARAYHAQPAIRFPATIGVAPQDDQTQLELRNLDAFGKLDALKSLPQVAGVVNVSSLVMSDASGSWPSAGGSSAPMWNKSDVILREAAAKLHADAVLLLKIESSVTDGKIFGPLSLLTLGTFPNDRTEVISTALAALVDTRTGYVYATAERSAGKVCHAMTWDDNTRQRTIAKANRQAMEKLLNEFPALWRGVVAKHRR